MELAGRYSNPDLLALLRSLRRPIAPASKRQTEGVREVQAQHRLSTDEIKQLVEEYKAGTRIFVLAARWRVNRQTVASHLKRAGVQAEQPTTNRN